MSSEGEGSRIAVAAIRRGIELVQEGNAPAAREAFETALSCADNLELQAKALFNLGLLAQDHGELDKARTLYERTIGLQCPGETGRAACNLGNVLLTQGDEEGAKDAYGRAMASGEPGAASQAALNLAILAEAGAQAAYGRALGSPDERVRQQAGAALARMRKPPTVTRVRPASRPPPRPGSYQPATPRRRRTNASGYVALLVLALVAGAVTGVKTLFDNAEMTRQRRIVAQLGDLTRCEGTPSIPADREILVWDRETNRRSSAQHLLPKRLGADAQSGSMVIVVLLPRKTEEVGRYEISREPAYRVTRDICVVAWPEKRVIGRGTVVSADPATVRTVEYVPEYGDSDRGVADLIEQWRA
jgi:tetratricopeptide (TPR) repeat protein